MDDDIRPLPDLGLFDYDALAPLNAEVTSVDEADGVRRTRLWIDGLDERVPVVVTSPVHGRPGRPRPVLLIGHGATTTKDDLYIQGPAARWAAQGLVCVAADAPLHGERSDAPFDLAANLGADPEVAAAFARRHVVDQRRALDLIDTLEGVDPARIGYLGFSMGTVLGVPLVAADSRIRCAVFTIGGSFGSGPLSPAAFAPLTEGRPVLQLNTESDELFGPDAVRALQEALGKPKQLGMFPGTHTDFGGAVFKAMWDFLSDQLDVDG